MPRSLWIVLGLGLAKALLSLAAFAGAVARGGQIPAEGGLLANVTSCALYTLVAVALLVLARRDAQAQTLAALAACIGSICNPLMVWATEYLPVAFEGILRWPQALSLEAFFGFASLSFASCFPRTRVSGKVERWTQRLRRGALIVGVILTAVLLYAALIEFGFLNQSLSDGFDSALSSGVWSFNALMVLPAGVIMYHRARVADVDERRRALIMVAGLIVSNLILAVSILALELVPGLRPNNPLGQPLLFRWFSWTSWLLPPVVIAYAVLVDQVFDLRLVLRQAIRYSLARTTLSALIALPFVGLVMVLFRERNQSLAQILSSGPTLALVGLAALALILAAVRRPLFRYIDRQFFREQYDARQILATLMERSREAASIRDLLALLMRELDRALHLDTVAALALDTRRSLFRSPRGEVRALPEESLLASLLSSSRSSLRVDLGKPDSPLNNLPHQEQQWLTEGAYHLLVPIISSDDTLIGLICLGEKRSELPYSQEDRVMLESVASSASLSLENRWMLSSQGETTSFKPISGPVTASPREEGGLECPKCGRVFELGRSLKCEKCERYLEPSILPPRLLDKYEVQRRLGAGGMGVVYQAIDEVLGRRVAIKTLPKVAPERALRLRREARVMATITHPNLALILAAEAFRGRPLLVFEYLDGGTLLDRLETTPLGVGEALDLGITIAGVLESAHASGILHRDVKPGNVAYTSDGVPKLLDFGLAKLIDGPDVRPAEMGISARRVLPDDVTAASITQTQQVVGTPAYLSPEAVSGKRAAPSFDLWSLALTVYECIGGENPMRTGSLGRTLDRISSGHVPDVRTFRPDCPREVATYLGRSLAADYMERPRTARSMRRDLEDLR